MYKKLADLVSSSTSLATLKAHAQELEGLQSLLCQKLESPLNQHVIVANFDSNTLLLHTDSPAWAAKLRFRVTEILEIVNKEGQLSGVSTIRIRVVIPENTDRQSTRNIKGVPAQTADYLEKMARDNDDKELAGVLTRLARHRKSED